MTYDLIIGDYAYSSWSQRAWLVFDHFDIPRRLTQVDFNAGSVPDQMQGWAPAKTVPAMRTPEGAVIGESLGLAEELASRHPDLPLWPTDPKARTVARALAHEMHAGFMALRAACPMNLRKCYDGFAPSNAVLADLADLARLDLLWAYARDSCAPDGPWLCGAYGIVDAMFAPVAARIAGYKLPVSDASATYVATHLAHPSFRRWRALGLVHGPELDRYKMDLPSSAWPGPVPRAAKAIDSGTPENATCPYSGNPVKYLLQIDGRTFGMCNALCRDKTVADPEAWPAFMALLNA